MLKSGDVERQAQACAEPEQPDFEKSLDPNTPLAYANGKWTVTYLLTVTNDSDLQLSYDLADTLGVPAGCHDQRPGPSPRTAPGVTPNPLWNGIVPATTVVDDQLIPANTEHVFKVTASATLTDGFELDDAECTGDPGSGLFNGAVMTSGGIPQEGEACAELPVAGADPGQDGGQQRVRRPRPRRPHDSATPQDWTLTAADSDSGTTVTGIDRLDRGHDGAGSGRRATSSPKAPIASPGSDLMSYYTAGGDWSCSARATTAVEIEAGDKVTCAIENNAATRSTCRSTRTTTA